MPAAEPDLFRSLGLTLSSLQQTETDTGRSSQVGTQRTSFLLSFPGTLGGLFLLKWMLSFLEQEPCVTCAVTSLCGAQRCSVNGARLWLMDACPFGGRVPLCMSPGVSVSIWASLCGPQSVGFHICEPPCVSPATYVHMLVVGFCETCFSPRGPFSLLLLVSLIHRRAGRVWLQASAGTFTTDPPAGTHLTLRAPGTEAPHLPRLLASLPSTGSDPSGHLFEYRPGGWSCVGSGLWPLGASGARRLG